MSKWYWLFKTELPRETSRWTAQQQYLLGFVPYSPPAPWCKRGTVRLVAEEHKFMLSDANAGCSPAPLVLLVAWGSSHFVISQGLMY